MLKSIKSKFIVFAVLFIILSVGIPMHFLVQQFKQNFEQRSKLLLESTLDMLIFSLENMMMTGKDKNVQKIVESIGESKDVEHIRIFSEDGTVLFSSKKGDVGKNIKLLSPHHKFDSNKLPEKRNLELSSDFNSYTAMTTIQNKKQCQSCHDEKIIAYLDVDTYLTRAEKNFFTGSKHIVFLGFAILLVLIFGLIFIFSKFINKPINELLQAFNQVSIGNLSVELPIKYQNEFGELSDNFNNMVKKIKQSQERIDELHFEQLLRADKLATIGEMTAQVAHEINNYSGIIFSRIDYLNLEAQRNPELKKFADDLLAIQNQVEKVSQITKNILRHSKKSEIKKEKVDLIYLINQSTLIFESMFKKKNIDLVKEFSVDKALILGNPNDLEQVIVNIIYNAIDAINTDGKIEINLSKDSEDKFVLSISDNGSGMDENTVNNIFSPFFTTKEKEKGTGLGLYIVKKICDNHNATISCNSKINQGTDFIIKFN